MPNQTGKLLSFTVIHKQIFLEGGPNRHTGGDCVQSAVSKGPVSSSGTLSREFCYRLSIFQFGLKFLEVSIGPYRTILTSDLETLSDYRKRGPQVTC